jgi:transposase-like protein
MARIFAEPPRAVIVRPNCPTCGTRTALVRIFPDRPGYDQRTYECQRCEHELTEVVRFQKAS